MPPTPIPTPTPTDVLRATELSADVIVPLFWKLLAALAVLVVATAAAKVARSAALRALERTRADGSTRLLIARSAYIAVLVVGVLIVLSVVGVPLTTVVALAGVLGLAASLALQDVLKNFVAGVYLLVERPFRIGEAIKVKEHVGRVETIDIRTTVLRADDGVAVVVPNAILFAEIIVNRGLPAPKPPEPVEEEPFPF